MHLLVPTAAPQSRPSNTSITLSISVAIIYEQCKHNKYSICTTLFFFIAQYTPFIRVFSHSTWQFYNTRIYQFLWTRKFQLRPSSVVFRSTVKELQDMLTYLLLHTNIIIKFHLKRFISHISQSFLSTAIYSDSGGTWREMEVPLRLRAYMSSHL